jgi:hypothetical protein
MPPVLGKNHPPTGPIDFSEQGLKIMIWHQNCCIKKTFSPSAAAGGRIVAADAHISVRSALSSKNY